MLTDSRISWLNKVPEVTLFFWLIKMMSTTVGETAADFLNMDFGWGLTNTTLLTGVLFVITLALQLRATRYVPALYWATVLLISVFGTLVTDNLTDRFGVPLAFSTGVFGALLILTFVLWFNEEKTLSIHSITTRKRELFYWVAILFTFSLGTAAGDWVAEGLNLGYFNAATLFGALILLTALAFYLFRANSVLCFWIAYILTRPFGASCGDLLSQSPVNGGVGLGTTGTSILFLLIIISLVGYLTFRNNMEILEK
ncbi:membrane protein [Enterobacter cloacae]|uniref:COG4705 family protein n=1 Tax=Enterobacter cloacae TaxID=550 RepID=UPI0006684981|nr:membrane protein [Enterobacter cloacae]